ncbi:hypothetical protein N3K66_000147 [Trichothecium roseum]|uniref:Uncharacterized protein n=1 Tax=Trichothecium roseum TaxID=47278 RepID=A0ACC0VCX1_9HYPO|nr:hypothetical protein N3K66_000147 [Trichothecium roseum]
MEVCPLQKWRRVGGLRAGRAIGTAVPPFTMEIITRTIHPSRTRPASQTRGDSDESWAASGIKGLASFLSWTKVRVWRGYSCASRKLGSNKEGRLLDFWTAADGQIEQVEDDDFIIIEGRDLDASPESQPLSVSPCGGGLSEPVSASIADDFEIIEDNDRAPQVASPLTGEKPVEQGYVWVERKSRPADRLPPSKRLLMEARQRKRDAEKKKEMLEEDGFIVLQDDDLF